MININTDPAELYRHLKSDIDYADKLQTMIMETLGPEGAYNELCKALSTDQKIDLFEWIARNYDIPTREG